jgi:MoaA/NifB/PqqE/SkfB family radical SAM enzyme
MIQTNGNLLSKRKSQILQIKDRINLINISIDASTPETYKIVRGGNWGIVMDGIEMIHELGIKGMIQLVLQRENYQDLLGFKELANKFDFWYQVQFMDRRQHMTEKYWNHNRIDNNPDVDYAQLKEYLNILKQDKNCNFDGGVQELYKSL